MNNEIEKLSSELNSRRFQKENQTYMWLTSDIYNTLSNQNSNLFTLKNFKQIVSIQKINSATGTRIKKDDPIYKTFLFQKHFDFYAKQNDILASQFGLYFCTKTIPELLNHKLFFMFPREPLDTLERLYQHFIRLAWFNLVKQEKELLYTKITTDLKNCRYVPKIFDNMDNLFFFGTTKNQTTNAFDYASTSSLKSLHRIFDFINFYGQDIKTSKEMTEMIKIATEIARQEYKQIYKNDTNKLEKESINTLQNQFNKLEKNFIKNTIYKKVR